MVGNNNCAYAGKEQETEKFITEKLQDLNIEIPRGGTAKSTYCIKVCRNGVC
jgi:hypothetical protein